MSTKTKSKPATAMNIMSKLLVENVKPTKGRILASVKSWPSQSDGGIIMSTGAVVIRGEQYVMEVEAVGEETHLVKKGDIVITSMYSGHHVPTEDGHVKLIQESDILVYKEKTKMDSVESFRPETFRPGLNFILIKITKSGEVTTDAGIITNIDSAAKLSKADVATKTAEVLAVGPQNSSAGDVVLPEIGERIILDAWVGLPLNNTDITAKDEYKIMYSFDILATIIED